MPKDKYLQTAIDGYRAGNCYIGLDNTYKSGSGNKCNYVVSVSIKQNKNAMAMLRNLPKVYDDIEKLSEVVLSQQQIIADQQRQIEHLSNAIDTIAIAKIQTEIGRELYNHISELANESNMYSHSGGKINLEIKSSFTNESLKTKGNSVQSESLRNSIKNVKLKMEGVLSKLLDMEINLSMKEKTVEVKKRSSFSEKKQKESFTMTGIATYEHKEITCDPSIKVVQKLIEKDGKDVPEKLINETRRNPFSNKSAEDK